MAKWLTLAVAVQQRSVASVFSVRLILPPSFAFGTNQVVDHHLVVSEMQQFFKDKLMVSETSMHLLDIQYNANTWTWHVL